VTGKHPVAVGIEVLRSVDLDDFRQLHHGLQAGHEFVQALVQPLGDPFGEMKVDAGGGDVGMTEDLLQDGDVFAILQKVGGKGVAVMPSSA